MNTWRVSKWAFKATKSVLENPKTRAKVVSTARQAWEHPIVRSKTSSLLRRFKGKTGDKPDKNQTRMF